MADTNPNNYLFLNRDGRWPRFNRSGLDITPAGTLQLSTVPLLRSALPAAVKNAPTPDGPAGVVVDRVGNLYFTEPDSNRLMRVSGCDASVAPVSCVQGGRNAWPGQLRNPRGLLIPPHRQVLFVADSGNHRIQIFDLDTYQLLEIWGAPAGGSAPALSSRPGRFNTPWTLAADADGNVYVVDYGNRRVQKFNPLGEVDPAFASNVSSSGLLQPVDIAIGIFNGKSWIFVADGSSGKIYVFDEKGGPVLDSAGQPLVISDFHITQPMGLAVSGDALYVGDNSACRIFRLQIDGAIAFVGPAIGYEGLVACLFADHKANLWVHPGDSLTPLSLLAQSGHSTKGVLWHPEPVSVGRAVEWHRLQALLEPLPDAAHLDLFAYASDKPTDFPGVDLAAVNPFSDQRWKPLPSLANLNLTDLYLGGSARRFLWIGALFSGDGASSPLLHQLRVEFDWPTYDPYLPAIYRNTRGCADFLPRLLSLFQSFFGEIEQEISALPALFDPFAAPQGFLPWLAGCLGLDLDGSWDAARQRVVLARIFQYYGKRGTPEGLREALRLFAGVNAQIDEPIMNASWWSLPAPADACCDECAAAASSSGSGWEQTRNSVLGWTTMLAPAQPQGAVVGTSADLDQSHLIMDEDFGAPLFTDVAYQFRVQVYRSQAALPEALHKIRAVLESEKPAHTTYELCIVDPMFRVGFQSRVGIDTVVSGPPRSLSLGSDQALGINTALAGNPANRLGEESRLGISTRLA
jgi:phage tail-like protein